MIKTLMAGPYINIQNAHASDPNISPGAVGAGQLRWNPNTHTIEVNDGMYWKEIRQCSPTIELNTEARELLDFVKKQRDRQRLVELNPSLQKAYDAINRAENNFDLLAKLTIVKPIYYHPLPDWHYV
jgi:hypothetical protein